MLILCIGTCRGNTESDMHLTGHLISMTERGSMILFFEHSFYFYRGSKLQIRLGPFNDIEFCFTMKGEV